MFSVTLLSSFVAFLIWVFSSLFVGVRRKLFMLFLMPSSGTSNFYCNGTELSTLHWDLHISMDLAGGFQRAQSSRCHHNQLLHWLWQTCHSCLCLCQTCACKLPNLKPTFLPMFPCRSLSHNLFSLVSSISQPVLSTCLLGCMVSHIPSQLLLPSPQWTEQQPHLVHVYASGHSSQIYLCAGSQRN